jgi:S-formylglutathione hydrolase FrmB
VTKTTIILALAGAALAAALAGSAAGTSRQLDTGFRSRALGGELHFEAYLPAGYAQGIRRYPVIYFLHGLPAAPGAYRSIGFVERALDRLGRPAILVVPQAARPGEPDPEYLDRGRGEGWETAIAEELPRVVDSRFRTVPHRDGRALIGLSAGGYGAMHLALEHLDEFSVVESWSGYFEPTNPAGTAVLDLGSTDRNRRASVHAAVAKLAQRLQTRPTTIAFYVGAADTRFRAENVRLHRELAQAGVAHRFALYPGGHSQKLWSAHAPAWLAFALDNLAAAQP